MLKKILALKKIAFNNINKNIDTLQEFENFICRWWRKKYNIPHTDQRFLNAYLEDMALEFFEDYFEDNPKESDAYRAGYNSYEEMDKDQVKKDMEEAGEEYTDEISYFDESKSEEEEVIDNFSTLGEK